MNNICLIKNAFENKKAFIAFITGGDPDIETTENLIEALAEAGTDIIEIGVPFSDPIAEGHVIQAASERALEAGCTVDMLFDMAKRIRNNRKIQIPLLFMTYINPVFVYGKDKFFSKCIECGINGVIIPDLPYEEREEVLDICEKYGIVLISMISPSSDERIALISKESKGFIYCVSSLGVTGIRKTINSDIILSMIKKSKEVSNTPCAVGFGISTPEQAYKMSCISDGIIVGSAIVKIAAEYGRDCVPHVKEYVLKMKSGMNELNKGENNV